jgi:hypothetical protein
MSAHPPKLAVTADIRDWQDRAITGPMQHSKANPVSLLTMRVLRMVIFAWNGNERLAPDAEPAGVAGTVE